MPKVSFVLPAYKRRFLKEAIESILAQTYKDFELIIVDDHSPENLKEIVDQFSDSRIAYHCNVQNLGGKDLVDAWNHAMSFATCEWCVLASDDDIYYPKFLETLVRLTEKYPKCDLFHARCAIINEEGNWTDVSEERLEIESQIQMLYARGIKLITQRAPDFMFRKDALKGIGGFVKFPLAWYSDDATWVMLSRNGCAHSSEILFGFRMSDENISNKYDRSVVRKLVAGEQFRVWVKQLLATLSSCNKEEEVMLRLINERIDDAIDHLSRHLMHSVKSLWLWIMLFKSNDVPKRLRKSFLGDRYPLIRLLWRQAYSLYKKG